MRYYTLISFIEARREQMDVKKQDLSGMEFM